jgi:hypothetical protein
MAVNKITNLIDMVPITDSELSLGGSDLRFKNLYLSGDITDGSNTFSISGANSTYLNKAGDFVTGELYFPKDGFIMKDADDVYWVVSINTDGSFSTSLYTGVTTSLLAENGNFLLTEESDYLIQE